MTGTRRRRPPAPIARTKSTARKRAAAYQACLRFERNRDERLGAAGIEGRAVQQVRDGVQVGHAANVAVPVAAPAVWSLSSCSP